MTQRNHKEWFKSIKSTTCQCGAKKTSVYSWGEYVRANWRTICHVCENCFPAVLERIKAHTNDCGCTVTFVSYRGQALPAWLKMPQVCVKDEVLKLAV